MMWAVDDVVRCWGDVVEGALGCVRDGGREVSLGTWTLGAWGVEDGHLSAGLEKRGAVAGGLTAPPDLCPRRIAA